MTLISLIRDYADAVRIQDELKAKQPALPARHSMPAQPSFHTPVLIALDREIARLRGEIETFGQKPQPSPVVVPVAKPSDSAHDPLKGL